MSKHLLISPLGQSPGAVSGVFFALRKAGFDISRVITVGTNHSEVIKAEDRLEELFDTVQTAEYIPRQIAEHEDLTEAATAVFGEAIGQALAEERQKGNTVHVAVTAGRAGMGALAALATNLYGADYLWHLWVPDEIAEGGLVKNLNPPYDEQNPFLNPTGSDDNYDLVRLPLIDLSPLHPFIHAIHDKGIILNLNVPLLKLFTFGQYRHLGDLFPSQMPVAQVDDILDLAARNYPQLPRDEQAAVDEALGGIFNDLDLADDDRNRLREFVKAGTIANFLAARPGPQPPSLLEIPWAAWQSSHEEVRSLLQSIAAIATILRSFAS